MSCNERQLPILKGVSYVCHVRLLHAPGAAMTFLGLVGGALDYLVAVGRGVH